MRYLPGGGQATTAEEVRELLLPYILSGYEKWDGNFGLFAGHAKDSGDFAGWFTCARSRGHRRTRSNLAPAAAG